MTRVKKYILSEDYTRWDRIRETRTPLAMTLIPFPGWSLSRGRITLRCALCSVCLGVAGCSTTKRKKPSSTMVQTHGTSVPVKLLISVSGFLLIILHISVAIAWSRLTVHWQNWMLRWRLIVMNLTNFGSQKPVILTCIMSTTTRHPKGGS